MLLRMSVVSLVTALLVVTAGCRTHGNNNQSPGWFASRNAGAPCHLTSNPGTSCFDAITGMPIPCPPQSGTTVIPGGSYPITPGARPDELPFPGPSDMIPRPGVPLAPPSAAPGDGSLLNSKAGQSVKTGSNK